MPLRTPAPACRNGTDQAGAALACKPREMAHAHTQRMIDAWRHSRGGRRLPARAELTPELLGSLLPQVFVLGLAEDGAWRFRLAGGFVGDLWGRELRGERFLDLWSATDRADALGALDRAREAGDPAVLKALALSVEGRALGVEVTLAPATGPTLAPDRVMGLMQPTGMVARLGGAPVRELRLAGREAPPRPALRLVVDNTAGD